MHIGSKTLSPALVVAMIALFVALGGTAGAVVTATVPLAKRALMADNAKKVNGLTATQIGVAAAKAGVELSKNTPGPASTAAGLVSIKTQPAGQIPPGNSLMTIAATCDAGSKIVGGGMSSDGAVVTFDSYPKNDTTWEIVVGNFGGVAASVASYALCLR